MKKSKAVPATLVAALAGVAAGGCSRQTYDCVDALGNVIPNNECRSATNGAHWVRHIDTGGFGSSGGFFGG